MFNFENKTEKNLKKTFKKIEPSLFLAEKIIASMDVNVTKVPSPRYIKWRFVFAPIAAVLIIVIISSVYFDQKKENQIIVQKEKEVEEIKKISKDENQIKNSADLKEEEANQDEDINQIIDLLFALADIEGESAIEEGENADQEDILLELIDESEQFYEEI